MISSTQVLVIGGGDGAIVKKLLEHPAVESITVYEVGELSSYLLCYDFLNCFLCIRFDIILFFYFINIKHKQCCILTFMFVYCIQLNYKKCERSTWEGNYLFSK